MIRIKRLLALGAAIALIAVQAALTPSIAGDEVLPHSGSWVKKSYPIAGTWSLEQRGNERVIVLDDDFKTKNAPDLKLFLSPLALDELTGKNATDAALFLGKLKSNKGGQEFSVPTGVDLGRFKTVIVHCEQYSKLWGGAALQRSDGR